MMATNALAVVVLLLSSLEAATIWNGRGDVPQVMLGSVKVAIGAPAADVLAALRREFWVLDLEDGVGVRSAEAKRGFHRGSRLPSRASESPASLSPGDRVKTDPSPHDLSRRLALATLGLRGGRTENSVRSVDGTEVSSVRFNCGNYSVFLVTSLAAEPDGCTPRRLHGRTAASERRPRASGSAEPENRCVGSSRVRVLNVTESSAANLAQTSHRALSRCAPAAWPSRVREWPQRERRCGG